MNDKVKIGASNKTVKVVVRMHQTGFCDGRQEEETVTQTVYVLVHYRAQKKCMRTSTLAFLEARFSSRKETRKLHPNDKIISVQDKNSKFEKFEIIKGTTFARSLQYTCECPVRFMGTAGSLSVSKC